ncbi:hypothetical protein BIV57_16410 [Mangrovactinospora gilvigrisea]|uniref:ABC-2 type transporter transmembrane domain-containing protein n=1 Tax=Mangrovactinospora gilvigrisea TaxID=1428644 RepID=A0A1J7BCM4_9ACTN|nr:YhgE/Pip domain-containing protein [Mangrovactinospora gilvigrisea]OIV36406.1 hypothetical protein BIV57_16410 [Mangrovactinospora gilvigrisea]
MPSSRKPRTPRSFGAAAGRLELARFGRGRLPRAAMAAVVLLPLLYGALYIWSMWDPYGSLDKLPVALVQQDRGPVGRDLAKELEKRRTFDWHPVSAERAALGLAKGDYYMSLTVPGDFTSRLEANGGAEPADTALKVRTNDSNSYLSGIIARSAFKEIRGATSVQASRAYYDKIFVSFGDIHRQTTKAAGGADRLTDGAKEAHSGSSKLKDGADRLNSGLGSATSGAKTLADGLDELHRGAARAAAGTAELNRLARADGRTQAAIDLLRRRPKEVRAAADAVAAAAGAVHDHARELPALTSTARQATATASAQAKDAYGKLCTADPAATGCPQLAGARDAAAKAATAASDADTSMQSQNLDQLAADAGSVQKDAVRLAAAAPHLADDLSGALADIGRLNTGVQQLSTGSAKLGKGASGLHTGLVALSSGAAGLDSGLGTLDGGLARLADGSGTLAEGLHQGAAKIPDYDGTQRADRSQVLSDPVQLAMKHLNATANYGTGFAPYFVPLALWVGVMVGYMLLRPLNPRLLSANAPARRVWLAGYLPAVALAVPQIAVLLAVLHFALGMAFAHAAAAFGFLLLTCAAFAAVLQFLNARFGPAGRVLGLALLMVQLTSAGGTYPVQTSPGFFNAVHPWLPMSWAVAAMRRLISGGDLTVVGQGCAVLAAYLVGFAALTVLTARRKQMWSLARLHPELTL